MQENVLAQFELTRLRRVVAMDQYMAGDRSDNHWLSWIYKLHDQPSVVSRAMKRLLKFAMRSNEECDVVESSMWRLKKMFEEHPSGSTDITCWGDIDAMFERLNHAKKDTLSHVNWSLEVEEGWVPYNTFSAHIKEDQKVVHACDPALGILEGHCSLCQCPFGPEGALTMGQCPHTFHVTCITRAALVCSVCPECRSPLSPRLYEMLGLLDAMPPGHEYN